MDHFREIKNTLSWHNEGKFQAEVVNGIITKLNFCEPGKGPQDTGRSLTSVNFKYLQAVYRCLGELFNFIEEENRKMGYRYAHEIAGEHEAELIEAEIITSAGETKLRPLINYEHEPGPTGEPLRDKSA